MATATAPGGGTPGDGSGRSGEVSFVRTEDWLGSGPPASPAADAALSVLLTRYLQACGPASVQDFGLPDIRPPGGPGGPGGPDGAAEKSGPAESDNEDHRPPGPAAPVAFLPKSDSYVLARRDKFYLEEPYRREVFRAAADVAATVVAGGVVVGTWRWQGSDSSRSVVPSLFGSPSPELVRLVGEEGSRLGLAGTPGSARLSRT